MSRVQRDHSICKAVMGWTACARLIVSGLASDKPIYFTFPSSTNLLSSPIYQTFQLQFITDAFKGLRKRRAKQEIWRVRSMTVQRKKKCRELLNPSLQKENFIWKNNKIYRFLYGYWCVHSMLIIEINVLYIQALKASFTTCTDIFRGTLNCHASWSHPDNTKLCC